MAVKDIALASGGIILISSCAAISAVATLWVILRCLARSIKRIGLQPEDYIVVTALFMLYAECSFIIAMTIKGGIGHHAENIPPQNLTLMFKLSYGMQLFYALGISLVKVSICMTLIRIFPIPRYEFAAKVALGLSVAWGFAVILNSLLICKPISMFWDPTTPGGRCGNQNVGFASIGALNVAVDFFILLIPLPCVLRLQMPLANRIGLLGIFLLGIATIAVGIARTITILQIDFLDSTYTGMVPDLLTALELGVAIVVASSTVLRPVFDKVFRSVWSATGLSFSRPSNNEADGEVRLTGMGSKTNTQTSARSLDSGDFTDHR